MFGWAFAGVLVGLALPSIPVESLVAAAVVCSYLGGSVLVLIATKGRHPGWIALLAVASLALAEASAY